MSETSAGAPVVKKPTVLLIVAWAWVVCSLWCSSLRASTRRIASTSVSQPNAAPTSSAPSSPTNQGRPSPVMKYAPKTPPSIAIWPVVMDSTFDVENITL